MLRAATAVTLAFLLAGCAGKSPAGTEAPGAAAGEGLAAEVLSANSSVARPEWAVGQWWQYQLSYPGGGSERFKAIVVDTSGSSAVVATDDDAFAKREAAYNHPLLGTFGDSLTMEGWGGSWDLFDFPLTDGARWSGTMPNIAWDVIAGEFVDLAMMASFVAKAPGPDGKEVPGFYIMGHAPEADNAMVLEGYFIPANGWFSELTFYDIDPDQDPLEVQVKVTEAGLNWTGTYFRHTAEPLLEISDASGFDDDPTAGGQPFADPHPHGTFVVSAQATAVYGLILAETVVGVRQVILHPPEGDAYQLQSTSAETDSDIQELQLDVPAVAGEWRLVTAGAGGYTWMYADIYEIVEAEFTL